MPVQAAVPVVVLSNGWCHRAVDRLGGDWPRQDRGEQKNFHNKTWCFRTPPIRVHRTPTRLEESKIRLNGAYG
jgi:hypothetical protein